eukprot:6626617-Pyramimonas_sp.AAC.1
MLCHSGTRNAERHCVRECTTAERKGPVRAHSLSAGSAVRVPRDQQCPETGKGGKVGPQGERGQDP